MNARFDFSRILIKAACIACLVGVLAVGTTEHARTDGPGIRVLRESVASELPEGIRFEVEVESNSPITDVLVRFTVRGRKASQYDYLDVQQQVSKRAEAELFFQTDTPQRYIPPGSVIEYRFEITDENGKVLETEPDELVLLDSRLDWDMVQAGAVLVYYVLSETRARDIADTVEQTLLRMGPIIGAETETRVNVTMYNNYADMIGAIVPSSTTASRELVTEGQAFITENALLVLGGGRRALGTASHEVTHILVGRAIDSSPFGIATWLNEGLAEYGNVDPGIAYDYFLEWAIDTERLLPLEQLERFPGDPNMVIVCYGQARSVVEYMVDTFGAGRMAALMARLAEGARLNDALQKTHGMSIRELDEAWRVHVGASPLPEKTEAVRPAPAASLPGLMPYSLTPVAGASQLTPPTPTLAPVHEPDETSNEPDTTRTGAGCAATSGPLAIDASWAALLAILGFRLFARTKRTQQ